MNEDIHLIQQVLQGNQPAFRTLVERYQSYVFTITFKVLKNREQAQEVAQDVFIKIYKTLGSFQQKSKFSTWLYTIAYRAALDEARKKKYYTESIEADDQYLQISDQAGKSPAYYTEQNNLNKQLEHAIQQLKPLDATVITLYSKYRTKVQYDQISSKS